MNVSVDVGIDTSFVVVMKPNKPPVTIWTSWATDIGELQWFRMAPFFTGNQEGIANPPGANVKIVSEGIILESDNTPDASITLQNLSSKDIEFFGVVTVVVAVLSAPSNY